MLAVTIGCVGVAVFGVWGQAPQQTVRSTIEFKAKGAACVSVKQQEVHARSNNVVHWDVTAEPGCKFEGQKVAIVFTGGANPGNCRCSADLTKNAARLTLTVKPHTAHTSYPYDILVGGRRIADPRLEVDP